MYQEIVPLILFTIFIILMVFAPFVSTQFLFITASIGAAIILGMIATSIGDRRAK